MAKPVRFGRFSRPDRTGGASEGAGQPHARHRHRSVTAASIPSCRNAGPDIGRVRFGSGTAGPGKRSELTCPRSPFADVAACARDRASGDTLGADHRRSCTSMTWRTAGSRHASCTRSAGLPHDWHRSRRMTIPRIAEPPLLSISLSISTLRSTRQDGQLTVRCHSANAWRGEASAVALVGGRFVTAAAATADLPSRPGPLLPGRRSWPRRTNLLLCIADRRLDAPCKLVDRECAAVVHATLHKAASRSIACLPRVQ